MTDLMTCAQMDALLAEWLEGTLDASRSAAVGAHVRGCSRCSALLASLDAPNAEAAALPDLQPSRDLWAGIEARITTPVVELATRPANTGVATPRRFGWMAQVAAAAALVTVTAGVTWSYAGHTISQIAGPDVRAQALAALHDVARNDVVTVRGAARGAGGTTRAVSSEGALVSVERTYDAEIGALRGILVQRRGELDPKTLAVLEKNLKVIDNAIAESRKAIQHDPANTGLGDQLATTLDKKLQLLRTAALLPPRA